MLRKNPTVSYHKHSKTINHKRADITAMDNDNNTPAGKEQETSPRGEYFAPKLELSDSTREVFEKYSKIPPNEVLPHVYAIVSTPVLPHSAASQD